MDINSIISEYDSMFGAKPPREILAYLMQKIDMSREEKDVSAEIILLNETIGFCRDAYFKEEGVRYAKELEHLMQELDFDGRIEYATTMLNLANAYRGFGMYDESAKRYDVCEEMYTKMLPEGDFLFAGLYNNRGLLHQEIKDWDAAIDDFRKALLIVDRYPDKEIEKATTRANLAAAMIESSPACRTEAENCLQEAIDIFEKEGGTDFHYSAALSALGTLYFHKKDYSGAAACFKKAMDQLYSGTGASDAYMRVKDNYELSMRYAGEQRETAPDEHSSFERSRFFYEGYLKPGIERSLPEVMDHLAVGYAGEGSEHFGFDDEYSKDHDYAQGCCVWLPSVWADRYMEDLKKIYSEAYIAAFGSEPDLRMGRQGVMEIDSYFERLTGIPRITMLYYAKGIEGRLKNMDDEELAGIAAAVNGVMFMDAEGTMSRLRRYFTEEMPEDFRRRKLATLTHLYSQAGQYNYLRSIKRGDYVTAGLYEARAVQTMLQIAFYMNRKYPPYLKLLCRGASRLELLPELSDIAMALADMPSGKDSKLENGTDNKALTFDIVASLILDKMKEQKMIKKYDRNEPFADRYIAEIAGLVEGKDVAESRDDIIEAIIGREWEQFDKTINEGGRADCQDNWQTFHIMRKSQYLAWPDELLKSFLADLERAQAEGRNLITEKYGRMMESTAPEKYDRLKEHFPVLDEERIKIQEQIIAIQTGWMERFAERYPGMAGNARIIHTADDTAVDTSYETYLRGEISTYSPETLVLYGRFIASLANAGRNLAEEIMGNTAKLLGYKDLEDAESKIAK